MKGTGDDDIAMLSLDDGPPDDAPVRAPQVATGRLPQLAAPETIAAASVETSATPAALAAARRMVGGGAKPFVRAATQPLAVVEPPLPAAATQPLAAVDPPATQPIAVVQPPAATQPMAVVEPPPPLAVTAPSVARPGAEVVAPRGSRRGLAIAGIAVAIAATALAVRGDDAPAPVPSSDPLALPLHVGDLELRAPPGWRADADAIYRGDPADPDAAIHVATAPLPLELSLPVPGDAALITATRAATRAIASRLAREGVRFDLAGCGVVATARAGTCRATIGDATLDAYLRVVGARAVIAIASAKHAETRGAAVAIVASIRLRP